MSKIDIIDFCGDCSRRYYDGNTLLCEKTGKETYENNLIPDWCPLPDTKSDIRIIRNPNKGICMSDLICPNCGGPHVADARSPACFDYLRSRLAAVTAERDRLLKENEKYVCVMHDMSGKIEVLKQENEQLRFERDSEQRWAKEYSEQNEKLLKVLEAAKTLVEAEGHYEGHFDMRPYWDSLKQAIEECGRC